jgi:hypothetical protein
MTAAARSELEAMQARIPKVGPREDTHRLLLGGGGPMGRLHKEWADRWIHSSRPELASLGTRLTGRTDMAWETTAGATTYKRAAEGLREELPTYIGDAEIEEYARSRYAHTQAALEARGEDTIEVWRGIKGDQADIIRAQVESGAQHVQFTAQPLSSWSRRKSTADMFAGRGVVVRARIPRSRVFVDAEVDSRFDGAGEAEVVVIAPDASVRVAATAVEDRRK